MLILKNRKWLFILALFLFPQLFVLSVLAESHEDDGKQQAARRIWPPQQRTGIRNETRATKIEWQRWKLSVLARRLDRDLARFETPGEWQSFLRLPDQLTSLKPQVKVRPDPEELQALLKRFVVVASGDQYEPVATMPSFLAVHDALETYVALLKKSSPSDQKVSDRKPPLSSEIFSANESGTELRWAQAGSIHRLPPVLTAGEHPELLTPPLKDEAVR